MIVIGVAVGVGVTLLVVGTDRYAPARRPPSTPSADDERIRRVEELYKAVTSVKGVDDGNGSPAGHKGYADFIEVLGLSAELDGMFERGEGQAVLDLLDKLVAMGPVAWPLVMELWVRIDADLHGDRQLGFSKWIEIAGHLESSPMTDVFVWSLTHEAPERFVEGAIYRLPWVQDLKKTMAQFGALLKKTDEPCVVVALVRGLRKLENAAARSTLLAALKDPDRKAATRATIAVHLAYQDSAWAKPVLEEIARTDADGSVRTAAAAALIALDPPVTGVIVAAIGAGVRSSGLRPGDIIVRYGERRTTKRMHLGQEINRRSAEPDPIVVELVRAGQRMKLHVPAGRLGLITREVKAKE